MPTDGDKTNNVDDLTEDDHNSTLQSERSSESSQNIPETPERKKVFKRKRGNNRVDKFDDFLDKLMKIHEESDRNYFHHEEKLLEMEERRQREN